MPRDPSPPIAPEFVAEVPSALDEEPILQARIVATDPAAVAEDAAAEATEKLTMKKTHAWIFDGTGVARKGWLHVYEGSRAARPADKGWRRMAELPGPPDSAVRIYLWADDVDKYIARIDIGWDRRWIIMEGLPALLDTAGTLNSLLQMGGFGARKA